MKSRFILPCVSLLLFLSCEEKDMPLFQDSHEIYFEKFFVDAMPPGTEAADSTIASFFFYPDNTNDIEAPLVVNLSGTLLTSDLKFKLKVIPEETEATPDEYTLDDFYTFSTGMVGEDALEVKDTIFIKLHRGNRTEELLKGIPIVLELIPNDEVRLGQVERIRAKIILTTATVRPAWWDEEVEDNLLGVYSEKKFKYFLNNVDKKAEMSALLIKEYPDRAIQLTMQFKAWLAKQNPPIEEIDGTLMDVKI